MCLDAEHIWLDIYDDNCRAIHIYEKFGFKVFNTEIQDNRTVLFYEKSL
ncbi:Histone acetyltransferase HPA2-like acetyltransferase (fragment) [Vibrio tapetis subsp. tapetis]|uniref:Histone acetyltransferase HPA2-like acetyltransferase n=1 Tax=Vibrio tapetis subsp. tapetis TaxID=1671868 RepID=A0A2N8ZK05_9VIBR